MSEVTEDFFRIIQHERDCLSALMPLIDAAQVDRAVQLLVDCPEKVVLIGVGKSGIIARKIAATFSSLGTRAIFMHASDALHGDIGIVSRQDVVVLLSNSGTTDEILLLLPHLKLRGVPHIAIVGNALSPLAREADVLLFAGVEREADAFNLAPTASTTCQLAIGDALAVAVANRRGITPTDFALNHPAGRLGKQLTLRVRDLMRAAEENPLIPADASFEDVLDGLARYQAGACSVIDAAGALLGIITDGDLRRILKRFPSEKWRQLTAAEMMTVNPISVTAEMLAFDAMRMMEERSSQISVLPVVDAERKCIGLLRLHDIVKAGLSRSLGSPSHEHKRRV